MQFELAHLKKEKEEEENILPFGGFNGLVDAELEIVSRGQTLFRTKGKGLGHGHRTTCRPGI